MPLQSTSGAASYDAFGGGVAAVPKYIEQYFSTFLYQGNDTTQAIVNGVDLSTKGGMVWVKSRTSATNNIVWDTARGVQSRLTTNTTTAAVAGSTEFLSSFNTTGFTVTSTGSGTDPVNDALRTYVSWSWAKAPKFFDVVTYTGNGTDGRTVAHSLGSTPGCIIVKRTDAANGWAVYHRAMNASPQDYMMRLNATDGAFTTSPSRWNNTLPTSTEFTLSGNDEVNGSGATYVAYLFAHNAGGFGLTGTDNVISCGSLVSTGGVVNVNLGYETQWLLIKNASNIDSWYMYDTMRGMSMTDDYFLKANSSNAESNFGASYVKPTATGFSFDSSAFGASGETYIYIAIRRGPMKVPTSGTSVFSPNATSSASNPLTVTTNFPVDLSIFKYSSISNDNVVVDRLRGAAPTSDKYLVTNSTAAEATTSGISTQSNTALIDSGFLAGDTTPKIYWNFKRAPSFFDEVCYTGNNNLGRELNHNLGVTPELIIVKCRNATTDGDASFPAGWWTAVKGSGANGYWFIPSSGGGLNSNNASAYSDTWSSYFSGTTTFNPFYVTLSSGTGISGNVTGQTYVAYLFATCPGVSKVGSYTGNGSTQTINCGFTGGARFVLIKRTSTGGGDWYVWDTARGIVSGNDPHLSLNTTAAEVTTDDTIDPDSTGFIVNQLAATNVNVTSATYIFLAIA